VLSYRRRIVFMLDIVAIIAAVLAIAIAVVLILASRKPDTFIVRRSAVMQAPAKRIFPFVDNFQRWASWSPWEKRDPAMKRSFSGTESGKGAAYAWDGNKNVGSGRMEILNASPPSKITIKLDFIKPFEGHNTAEFAFVPERDASATNVIWVMQGPSSFMSKMMQVFMNLDAMIGRDFEAGLANLKKLTEQSANV
jgi:Polyketide cyclase / dehydrase and lipid transport